MRYDSLDRTDPRPTVSATIGLARRLRAEMVASFSTRVGSWRLARERRLVGAGCHVRRRPCSCD
jgi:hypothetical protein